MSERTYSEDDAEESSPSSPLPSSQRTPVGAERFSLGREIGRGGMGRVVEAADRQFDRTVAVKLLLGRSAQARARFDTEARVTGQLDHPGIPSVHERGELDDGTPFYVMHLAHGRTLASALDDAATLAERLRYLPVLIQAAQALGFAHERGVVHRDVKPQNIIVGTHGRSFLLDWGIARAGRSSLPSAPTEEDRPAPLGHTMQGSVMGTPAYMSPEQARGDIQQIDSRTDVFALGAILYHLLSGRCPYPGATAELTLAAAADARWEPLATVAPNSPAGLRQICNRAMARDPADRFRDATEMALALDGFLSTAVLAQPDRRVERFATATVVAAGLLLLVMTLGVWSTVGSLREQGVVSLMYLSVAAMGGALSLVEWRTDGRHKLDALILVFAMLTFLFGITGSAMGLESVLARVAELGSADPTWLAGQGAGALLRGCWEALGGIPSSAHLAAAQLLAWGILRRKRQKANAG